MRQIETRSATNRIVSGPAFLRRKAQRDFSQRSFLLPRLASGTRLPSRDLYLKRGSSYRLLSSSSRADRFGGQSSDRAAHAPARRLGIGVWQEHSWTKALTQNTGQTPLCYQGR